MVVLCALNFRASKFYMMCEVMIQVGKRIAAEACFYGVAALAKVCSDRKGSALRECDCAGSKVVPTDRVAVFRLAY